MGISLVPRRSVIAERMGTRLNGNEVYRRNTALQAVA